MPVELDVRVEMNAAAKKFPTLWRQIPRYTASALNETAAFVRKQAVDQVARRMRLPKRFVAKRISLDGSVKADRIKIRRATAGYLTATLDTYVRGIPVAVVAGAQTNKRGGRFKKGGGRHPAAGGGVKAKGGRLYKGAFKVGRNVFKRMTDADVPLMVPKIGVREQIDKEMQRQFVGAGKSEFKRRLERRLQFELTR